MTTRRPSWAVRVLLRSSATSTAPRTGPSRSCSTPWLDGPLRRVSNFANFSKPWFLVAGSAGRCSAGARGRRAAVTGVAAIGVTSLVVNQPMKLAGGRGRPDRTELGVPENALGADADVDLVPLRPLGVGGGVRRRGRRRAARARVPLRVAATVVAFSRVYTGVHYPGDVVVGAAVGAVLGRVTSKVAVRLHTR